MMASRHRLGIDEAHRPFVIDKSGNVTNTIVRGGRVVGVWDVHDRALRVAALPGEHVDTGDLVGLRTWDEIDAIEPCPPRPLTTWNAFHAPLR